MHYTNRASKVATPGIRKRSPSGTEQAQRYLTSGNLLEVTHLLAKL